MPGKGTLTLTGQLGDVMKESASIALSYVRSKGLLHGVDASGYAESDVHVHVPAGAIPKDGPSAGVTMTVALSSLLTGRPVKHNVGMTGEVTLQGRVLPVGGIKQKVLAAHRAGLTEVIIPGRNAPDLDDVPEKVRNEMTFHPVFTIDEALTFALEPAEVPAEATVVDQHVPKGGRRAPSAALLRFEEGSSSAANPPQVIRGAITVVRARRRVHRPRTDGRRARRDVPDAGGVRQGREGRREVPAIAHAPGRAEGAHVRGHGADTGGIGTARGARRWRSRAHLDGVLLAEVMHTHLRKLALLSIGRVAECIGALGW